MGVTERAEGTDGSLPLALVDTHCHLDAEQFAGESLAAVLERAATAGVRRAVTIGIDLAGSRRAVALAEAHPALWATVGVDPNDLDGYGPQTLADLRQTSRSERVVAIGEIGLDYHWLRSPPEVQLAAFREQLALARERSLPVVIHSRDAHDDTLSVLAEWSAADPAPGRPRGVMHCFSGDLAMARAVTDMGFLVSLAGNVTYPGARELQRVAAQLDDSALVLETDAPYLAPEGRRGSRNEPANVRAIAEHVAGLRTSSLADVARFTTANAARLFGWGPWPA